MSHNSWSKKIPSQHFLPNRQQPKLWKIELGYIHDFFFHEILLHAKLSLIKNFWVNMSTSFGDRLIVLKKIDWKFKCCYLIGWIQIWINFLNNDHQRVDVLTQKLLSTNTKGTLCVSQILFCRMDFQLIVPFLGFIFLYS